MWCVVVCLFICLFDWVFCLLVCLCVYSFVCVFGCLICFFVRLFVRWIFVCLYVWFFFFCVFFLFACFFFFLFSLMCWDGTCMCVSQYVRGAGTVPQSPASASTVPAPAPWMKAGGASLKIIIDGAVFCLIISSSMKWSMHVFFIGLHCGNKGMAIREWRLIIWWCCILIDHFHLHEMINACLLGTDKGMAIREWRDGAVTDWLFRPWMHFY